tara:strand:- start:904 stop:4374 length:3471 start_codon:yes stop_codon:yes gene_type:complete
MKKNLPNHAVWLKFMQISLTQMVLMGLFTSFSYAIDLEAQALDKIVTLHAENQEVPYVLQKLEKQTEVRFVFSPQVIRSGQRVTINLNQERLGTVLEKLLAPLGIKYEVSGKYVLLSDVKKSVKNLFEGQERQIMTFVPADITIVGKVTDSNGEVLPGVNILVKGTQQGSTTNAKGLYSIEVPNGGATLVFSFVGYQSQEIQTGNRNSLDIILKTDDKALEEVVVVGYGSQKRREVVGSISKINGSDVTKVPTASFAEGMQGQSSGLLIQNTSGHPGAAPSINIRGKGSINLNSSPLWIVDGVPIQTGSTDLARNGVTSVSPIAMINPNDIESIEVLKDAAATAIYGNRGSNGVIIVTTKSAKSNKTGITVTYDGGMSRLPYKQNDVYVDTKTWWTMVDKAWANTGNTSSFEPNRIINTQFLDEKPPMTREEAMAVNTDHLGAMTQDAGFHQVGLSANKGFESGGVLFSLNYRDEKGLLLNNNLKRLTGRFNFNFSPIKALNIGINTSMLYLKNSGVQSGNGKGFGGWGNWVAMMPWFKLYDPNSATGYWAANSGFNGLAFADPNLIRNDTDEYRTISNAYAELKLPLEGLKLRSEVGIDLLINNGSYWRSELLDANAPFNNEAAERSITRKVINYNAFLNYEKTFGKNSFLATAGAEAVRQSSYTRSVEGSQVFSTYPELRNPLQLTDGDGYKGGEQYLMGMFGRLNYVYNGRYILSASVRRDGHSVLNKNNRWATFSSLGAGWIITDEKFFNIPGISMLKLRGSYGTTGNTGLSTEMVQLNYGLSSNRYGGAYLPGATTIGPIGSSNLKWETTTGTDIGLDFGFLNDRISGSLAYYVKKVSDLILRGNVPISTGFNTNAVWENIGDLKNWGYELDLSSTNINKNNFTWNTDFNISFNDNKIIKLNEFEKGKGAESSQTIRKEGEKLDTWYLANFVEIDPQKGIAMIDERDQEVWNTDFKTVPTGKLIPMNKANVEANKMILSGKSALPTFFGGITNRFSYKNLDLTMLLVYAGGGYELNSRYNRGRTFSAVSNIAKVAGKVWEKPGDIADLPELRWGNNFPYDNDGNPSASGTNFETANNNIFFQKTNYLRIRNIQLGFRLPGKYVSKVGMQNVRLYVGGMNLYTFTKFNGLDPETNESLTIPRNFNFGISITP